MNQEAGTTVPILFRYHLPRFKNTALIQTPDTDKLISKINTMVSGQAFALYFPSVHGCLFFGDHNVRCYYFDPEAETTDGRALHPVKLSEHLTS